MKRNIFLSVTLLVFIQCAYAQTNSNNNNINSNPTQNTTRSTSNNTNTIYTSTGKIDSVALKQLLKSQNISTIGSATNATVTEKYAASVYNNSLKSNNATPVAVSFKDKGSLAALFATYKSNFVDALWKVYPEWATSVGYHKYDSLLSIPDDVFRAREANFIQNSKIKLLAFNKDSLMPSDQMDYLQIENFIEQNKWSNNELKQYQWDPSSYNIAGSFSFILTEKYATLDARLMSLFTKMNYVESYYQAARKNIVLPTKEHTTLAINQLKGGVTVFTNDMLDSLKKSSLSAETKTEFIRKANACATTINDFTTYLQSLDTLNTRSFRLGSKLYESKFKYDIQSHFSTSELLKLAMERKTALHVDMLKIAISMWPKYFGNKPMPANQLFLIKAMIDTISSQHSTPEKFQSSIEKQIPVLVKFVTDKNLIYLDPSKPLKVRKEPDYMAGVAGASISSPGPYDKGGNTYYNVGSLAGMTTEQQESYLREYNDYILQILNIHEAIPGHYTQGIYANQSPSIIKTILGNGSMVEGWAVYSELMMLENGYGNNAPEMQLMYAKWNLRSVCNTILDISVHTSNMSETEAKNLLMNEAFQQEAETNGKWKRVQLTSVQLCSYYNGFKEIMNLRDEMKTKEGVKFSLKAFHEKFLSYGSIPVKNIRRMMVQ